MYLGLSLALALASPGLAKADNALWQCEGANIEGLSISNEQGGKFAAGVSWDCWPGGGICERNVKASRIAAPREGGNTVFQGPHFTLVLHTDSRPGHDGSISAHISATAEGPADQGGGLSLSEEVTCTSER